MIRLLLLSLLQPQRLVRQGFLELTDFLGQFALILHILDACLMQNVELLLVEFSLLRSDLALLLELGQDIVCLGGLYPGLLF